MKPAARFFLVALGLVMLLVSVAVFAQNPPPATGLNPCTGLPAAAPYYDDIDLTKPWPVCASATLPRLDANDKGVVGWRWCKGPSGRHAPQWAVIPWADFMAQPVLALELTAAGLNMNEDALKAVTAKYAAMIKPLAHPANAAIWCPLWPKIAATKPADAPPGPPVATGWIVAKNGTMQTRPTYLVTAGRRAFVSNGAVLVGAACDTTRAVLEGPLTFGYPAGAKPDSVALCVRG